MAVPQTQSELADEWCRVYWKEHRRILAAAHKARWFERRVLKAEMLAGMRSIVRARDRSPAQLARLTKQLQQHHNEFTGATALIASCQMRPGSAATSATSVAPPIDDQIKQALQKAEARFIKRADKAGWFKVQIPSRDIVTGLAAILAFDTYPASSWSQLKQKRNRIVAKSRGGGVRRKVILGGFVVAQCRHKPDLHKAFANAIKAYLCEHPKPAIAEKNIAALAGFLADPHDASVNAAEKEVSLAAAKARNHRQILLGAWLLAHKDDNPAVEKLIAEELAGFLAESPVKVSPLMFQDLLD